MNDVTFDRNGPYGVAWLACRPGRSLRVLVKLLLLNVTFYSVPYAAAVCQLFNKPMVN